MGPDPAFSSMQSSTDFMGALRSHRDLLAGSGPYSVAAVKESRLERVSVGSLGKTARKASDMFCHFLNTGSECGKEADT